MSKSVQGYKVIPVQFSSSSTTCHELFVKEHSVRSQSEDKPPDRTLFVLNVPPYATQGSLRRAFSCAGPVAKIILQSKANLKDADDPKQITGFKVAYIIYQKSSSVERALNLTKLEPLSNDECPVVTGMQKWATEYNAQIYNNLKLEEEVNKFMQSYDAQIQKQKQQEKQKDDGGGWTVVSRKGRNPGMSRKESVKNKLIEKKLKGERKKQLTDFYTFQKRESKMNHLAEMRRKYEEDKKKVNAMQQARKFKPF